MANTLMSVQIIPRGENVIPLVDAAIAIIEESGVLYEVNPLETTMEGELTHLLSILEKMNHRMIELGSPNVISQVKIFHQPNGVTMKEKIEKYRG